MEDNKNHPVTLGNQEIPRLAVNNLSFALSVALNVYNESNSYSYKVDNRYKDYNVDGNKIYEFSHLLYELSNTGVGKAAIEDVKSGARELKEKLEKTLEHGEEKILSEKRITGSGDLAVICIAHALKDIAEIKDKMIINQEHFDAIISALGETENGRKAIEKSQKDFGVPSDNVSGAATVTKHRTR